MIFAANLANYEKLLQQKYEVSSSIWHKGERGRQRENGLMMFLRETLPAAYGVASGEIMPFKGKKPSPQCDIIVYDKLRTPVFGRNQAVQQIPFEGGLCSHRSEILYRCKGYLGRKEKIRKKSATSGKAGGLR
jgi:hypothetical protein